MALMTWNTHFVTGVDIIDQQHRWLIDLINASAPLLALEHGANPQGADRLLDELMNYATFHFETESRLIKDYRIDRRHHELHHASHARFGAEVERMRQDYANGSAPSGNQLLSFLANWLIYHILGEDQALARQIRAVDAGVPAHEAYDRAEGSRTEPTHDSLTRALIDVYILLTEQNRQLMDNNLELAKHRSHLEGLVHERTADLLRALDAAQTANHARSTFLANMSHEIRTPMNAIVGLTWSLRQRTTDPAQRQRHDQIWDAANKLQTIINDLLDMARIESDRLTLEPLAFDPASVLREVVAGVSSAAAVKGLVLKLEAAELPPLLRGDPVRLGQIVGNLASNAVKFTERGRVEIRARTTPEGDGHQVRLHIEVVDTGPGIEAEALQQIFQPFEQLDASMTRQHGGTGLGLTISHRLAELMGGKIGVSSTPGQGSTFWIEVTLDCVEAATDAAVDSAGNTADAAGAPATPHAVRLHHRETLRRLATLLADDDVRAIGFWQETAAQLRDAFDGHVAAFESALAAYDFATAHVLLMQAMTEPDATA